MYLVNNKGHHNRISIPEKTVKDGRGSLSISSSHCVIEIGENCQLRGLNLTLIDAEQCRISIGKACILGGNVVIKSAGCLLKVGENTTWMNPFLSFHEAGSITMGKDCMLSGGIRMDVSDMHSIIDIKSRKRINPAENITIGNHVWIGQGVFITKGVTIGDDVIIGAGSIVTKDIPNTSLVAGVPAKIIRQGVTWDRRRL